MSISTPVPLIDLKAQGAPLREEIKAAIAEVVDSQYFILGPKVNALEDKIAHICKTKYAVGCASGSDAIMLSLMAHDIGPGDEVICPAFTFFATAGYITRVGATPVFADIDPDTYNINPDSIRAAASRCNNLKAIMPVHLYGQCANMSSILDLGKELGVPIIEDAAQAIGSRDAHGRPAGSIGSIGCFSFFPTKNLGAYGDGGVLTTDNKELADRMKLLRCHGAETEYVHKVIGVNSRLDALQAAVLLVKLQYLEKWNEQRRVNAAAYDKLLAEQGAQDSRTPIDNNDLSIRTPYALGGKSIHTYHQYVIRVAADSRAALIEHLAAAGIGSKIYYPVPLHNLPCFNHLGYTNGDFPHAEKAAREVLALPIHQDLTAQQRDHVVSTLGSFSLAPTA